MIVPWISAADSHSSFFAHRSCSRDSASVTVSYPGKCVLILWKRHKRPDWKSRFADIVTTFSHVSTVQLDCGLRLNDEPCLITSDDFLISGPQYVPQSFVRGSAVARIDVAPYIDAGRLLADLESAIEDRSVRHKGLSGILAYAFGTTRPDRVICSSLIGNAILRQPDSPLAKALKQAMRERWNYGEIAPADLARMAAALDLRPEDAPEPVRTTPILFRRSLLPGPRPLMAMAVLLGALFFLFAQSATPILPFATSNSIAGFSFTDGITLMVRAPDNTYSTLRFNVSGTHGLLSSMATLMKIISGSVPFSMSTAGGPVNVGRASQIIAVGDFTGDNALSAAWIDPSPSNPPLAVYLGTPSFLYRGNNNYTVGSGAGQVLSADFNRDGKIDLAVAYGYSGVSAGVAIFLNKGDGTFASPVNYSAGTFPYSMAALDVNHDGIVDLAVTDFQATPGKVNVFLGKGDGTFGPATGFATDVGAESVTIADFNNDGNPDLAVTTVRNTVSILLGNGSGGFAAPVNFATGQAPRYIAAGDFNKDGKLDLVTSNFIDQTVSIFLGHGDGTFQARSSYVISYNGGSLILTDVDNDGKLDIVQGLGDARAFGPGYDSSNIDILLGNGDGTFRGVPVVNTPMNGTSFLVAGDFNGDGKGDIVAGDQQAGKLYLLPGDGSGAFQQPVSIASLDRASSFYSIYAGVAGDFNGDGKTDLAVSQASNGKIAIFLNSASGLLSSGSISTNSPAANGIAAADFNGDGKLDLAVAGAPADASLNGPSSLNIFFGGGNGSFQLQKTYPSGNQAATVAVGDLNGDGKPDVVVVDAGVAGATNIPGAVYVFLNDGQGGFLSPKSYVAGTLPITVSVADVNGDGKMDLVAATEDQNIGFHLAILLNNGNGTFQAAKLIDTDFGPSSLAVRDFNGDGKPDIVVAHCCGATDMTYFQGNGDGTFVPEIHFNAGPSPDFVVATDLNGDGKPDLAISTNGSIVTSILNTALPVASTSNWASGTQPVAPNSVASVYGAHLANTTASGSAPPGFSLGGTSVTVTDSGGLAQKAGLYYASPTQLNILVPPGIASGTASVSVVSGDGVVSAGNVQIAPTAPGVLVVNGNLLNAYVVHYDAQGNPGPQIQTVQLGAGGTLLPTPITIDPSPGSVYLLVYGTGISGASQSQVSVQIAATKIIPAYAGVQGQFPGLDQINVQLPFSLKGAGDVAISVTAAGQTSNSAHLTIQ